MANKKFEIGIDGDLCKGCGICVDFCPKKVFDADNKINPRGYYQPAVNNPDDCVGCGLCELLCPDLAIVVMKK